MRLSAELSQRQTFSPQMQQGLRLLQAPLMEMRQLISSELAMNPLLEEDPALAPSEIDLSSTEKEELKKREDSEPWREEMNINTLPQEVEERRRHFLESRESKPSLHEILQAQISAFPKKDKLLAETIIGNLDEWGYLRASNTEIALTTGSYTWEIQEVLKKIQLLEPAGIAARDLRECLLLQLERQKKENSLAARIVKHYLPQLAKHDYQEISKALRLPLKDILEAAKNISHLEPHPGSAYTTREEQSILADIIVTAEGDEFITRINEEVLPRLRINNHYKEMLSEQPDNIELRGYLRDKIHDGKTFIHFLEQRQKTLLAVCREIVKCQYHFFQYGTFGLHSLSMTDVANSLNIHATTVGRAIAGKYMETPHGLFPLKYFFTIGFEHQDGSAISNETVKMMLRQLINEENKQLPLSDQQLVFRLQEQGMKIARRTVAHYREELGLLPKKLRKKI